MKRLVVILAGAAAAAAAVLWWRRRTQAATPAPVQLGLADGSTLTLATGDPAAAFAPIRIPCLLMTGTQDGGMMITTTGPADRLKTDAAGHPHQVIVLSDEA